MSDHGHFSSYEGHKERRTGKTRGFFKDAQGFGRLDAGSRASFSSRPSTPWTLVFRFPSFCTMCGLEKFGLDQNWMEHNSSALLLRKLVVGRRQQSESIEATFYME